MSQTSDPLLTSLYHSARDAREHSLVTRCAPVLCFDIREPFLPVAAGYTIFTQDGPSSSMQRDIQLRPAGRPPASTAIEYAIWWDWDIHHLYELEHAWVYLNAQEEIVRVEGSWHGEFNPIELRLQDGHPVLLSEPGKHALAGDPQPFHQRAAEQQRIDAAFVSAQAHVLINAMFRDFIRRKPFDNTLVRSYLVNKAFEPSWDFSQEFRFSPDSLVPWPALRDWIPARVNSWVSQLEASLTVAELRPLRLVNCDGSLASLEAAARSGADGVVLPVHNGAGGLPLTGSPDAANHSIPLDQAFRYCRSVPMRAMLDLRDDACITALAGFLNEKKVFDLAPLTAQSPAWLARFKALAPRSVVIAQVPALDDDPVAVARACSAAAVLPRWEQMPAAVDRLSAEWIERAHAANLQVISWPLNGDANFSVLAQRRIDAVWLDSPDP